MKPRLGHIKFINCLPLTYALQAGGYNRDLTVRPEIPSQLNQWVLDGQLDVSPVSSIIYAKSSEKLLVLPDVSISANGALQSILLVSKYPIKELSTARIALTVKSATSHVLLKIILHHGFQANPDYFISGQTIEDGVLDAADAVLFIGDDALYAYHYRTPGYYYYDIGDQWKKLTGLAMVYALWVVNREFAERDAESLSLIYRRVTEGFAFGLSYLTKAAETLTGTFMFTSRQIIDYIHLLNYQFTPAHEEALITYYKLAHTMGLIEKVPDIQFAKVCS